MGLCLMCFVYPHCSVLEAIVLASRRLKISQILSSRGRSTRMELLCELGLSATALLLVVSYLKLAISHELSEMRIWHGGEDNDKRVI